MTCGYLIENIGLTVLIENTGLIASSLIANGLQVPRGSLKCEEARLVAGPLFYPYFHYIGLREIVGQV